MPMRPPSRVDIAILKPGSDVEGNDAKGNTGKVSMQDREGKAHKTMLVLSAIYLLRSAQWKGGY